MKPTQIPVIFECPALGCGRTAMLHGTPERVVQIAVALGWHELKADHLGPLPLMACNVACWQRYWLSSDDVRMRNAVEQMIVRGAMQLPGAEHITGAVRCKEPN
jgi:hypothetical protein